MRKIIFGGAFDPIHNGHVEMAEETSKLLDADVIFVPSKNAVWKESVIDKEFKLKMVELAIKNNHRFSICDYELNSDSDFVYSIDTVKYLNNKYKNDELYFLIGYDQGNLFHKWKNAKELSNLAKIVVYKRPELVLNKDNVNEYNMMVVDDKKLHDISSTDIRDFKALDVPYEVIDYIEKNDLYYIPKLKEWYKDRYEHVLGTAKTAYDIAKANDLDCNKAYIAGFLHDLGKMVHLTDESEYPEEFNFLNNEAKIYKDLPKYALHQVLGVFYAKRDYEINDEEILNSILFHCTGNENMSWLDKIVYSADKIEPSRGYDSTELINAMLNDVDEGFVTVLRANMDFINSKDNKGSSNEYTQKCCKQYLNQK